VQAIGFQGLYPHLDLVLADETLNGGEVKINRRDIKYV